MPENNTPNTDLGKLVIEILVSEGLILPENETSILQKICDGKMTSSEWKSSIEKKILNDGSRVNDAK